MSIKKTKKYFRKQGLHGFKKQLTLYEKFFKHQSIKKFPHKKYAEQKFDEIRKEF